MASRLSVVIFWPSAAITRRRPNGTSERGWRGPLIHDVRTEGGGGCSKADNSTDRLHKWDSDKERGSKNPKFLQTSFVNGPEGVCQDCPTSLPSLPPSILPTSERAHLLPPPPPLRTRCSCNGGGRRRWQRETNCLQWDLLKCQEYDHIS